MAETEAVAPDRRTALKERHRRAILRAAAELMDETGGIGFSVETLATRADVSRRTVFNHFASLDDIALQVSADIMGELVEHVIASAATVPDHVGAMFDEVVHALRTTDLVTPMAYLTRTSGIAQDPSPPRAALMLRSVDRVRERFSAAMTARHPDADPLDVELLVNALFSGVVVLHRHWFARTGAADDEASRQVWAELFDRLVATVRDGYPSATSRTRSSLPAPSSEGQDDHG